jgi:hypothetical protein
LTKIEFTDNATLDFVNNVEGDRNEPLQMINALKEGYRWSVVDGLIVCENPEFEEPDGTPNITCSVESFIHLAIFRARQQDEDDESRETLLDDMSRIENENEQLTADWKKISEAINRLPELLPWKFKPSHLKRS